MFLAANNSSSIIYISERKYKESKWKRREDTYRGTHMIMIDEVKPYTS